MLENGKLAQVTICLLWMKGSCSIKGVLPKGLNFDMVVVGYGDSGTFEDILNSVD